jgi:hypothetical protein
MKRALLCGLASLAGLSGGCLLPYVIPPSRADIGFGSISGAEGTVGALNISAGVSVASASLDPAFPFDLGFGYQLRTPLAAGAPGGPIAQGMYLSGGKFVYGAQGLRLFFEGRGELLLDDTPEGIRPGFGAVGRITGELFLPGEGNYESSGPDGFTFGHRSGTGGINLFLESGYEVLPGGEEIILIAGGLGFRIPAAVGLLFFIPDF